MLVLKLTNVYLQAGLVVATGAEPSFHLLGFLACLVATIMRALKSVIQVLITDP